MAPGFATTRWSLVLAAGASAEDSQAALAELCEIYWYPVYSFIRRRRSHGPDEPRDLTQEFFAGLLERRDVASADPNRGRFRSWLLKMVKNFLANDWDRITAKKRDFRQLSWPDAQDSDRRYLLEPAHAVDPERLYHRNWSFVLLERVLLRLREDCATRGKQELFEQVKGLLIGPEGDMPVYAPHAEALGMRADTLKVEVHRLRQHLGELLRAEIAELVDTPDEIQSEIDFLLASLTLPDA
jgi:RNA polymerase sigma factor (sigma-70 family)